MEGGSPVSAATEGEASEGTPSTAGGAAGGAAGAGGGPPRVDIEAVEELPLEDRRDVGREAVWTLSGAKPGNGVEQLVDDNVSRFARRALPARRRARRSHRVRLATKTCVLQPEPPGSWTRTGSRMRCSRTPSRSPSTAR